MLLSLELLPVHQAFLGHDGSGRCVLRIEYVFIKRSQLDGGVQGRCGGAAYEERNIQTPPAQFPAKFLHLVQRWCNQSACADDGRPAGHCLVNDSLLLHHHSQVHDLKAVAVQDNAGDILSDIVHVSLDCSIDNQWLMQIALLIGLHVRLQHRHRLLHYPGGFDHLRQEHLSCTEQFSDLLHAGHQRPFDYLDGSSAGREAFQHVLLQMVRPALDQSLGQPVLHRNRTPVLNHCHSILHGLFRRDFLSFGDQPFRSVRPPVQYHILGLFQQVRLDFIVNLKHARIDNSHIQAGIHGVVEEDGVHCLADLVVAPECE